MSLFNFSALKFDYDKRESFSFELLRWEISMTPAERLKKMRGDKSQKEMAALLGINYRTYENYEKGLNDPSWSACEAIAKLGFNANWLLTGEGEMKRGDKPAVHDAAPGWEPSNRHPASKSVPDAAERPLGWFYEWLEDELRGKSVTEIMRFAVKIKAELDKEREG